MTKETFFQLPEDIQNQVKSTLKVYDKINVDYYNGEYHASTSTALLAKYPTDFKTIGIISATDIYTEEERTQNYIESFHDYPIWYKGERDYKALKEKYGD